MPVIQPLRPLELDHKDGVASVTLWLCDPFDFEYSFRGALLQIEKALATSAPTTHSLPPKEVDEDFVEGQLIWGSRTFSVYFEHALGYMLFSSPSLADVQALEAAL
jgi:hypothetical protein